MIDPTLVEEFLAHRRIAVVGASDDRDNFARTIYENLRDHGYDVAAVNRHGGTVAGDPCHPDLGNVPGPVDGVIVMVGREAAADVVRECIALGIRRVWLFKGVGKGAVSDEAIELCEHHGLSVVAGACPLMFLEPAGWFHRLHRGARRLNRSLARSA